MPASGRDYQGVQEAIKPLKIKPKCVCLNGAEFYDNDGNIVISNPIDHDLVLKIYSIIEEFGCEADYYTTEGRFICLDSDDLEGYLIERFNKMFKNDRERDPIEFLRTSNVIDTFKTESTMDGILNRTILKVELFVSSKEMRDNVLRRLSSIDGIITTSSHENNLEVNAEIATKGNMVKKICEWYGYNSDEVVVIGDGRNDIPMLEMFPNSYAMGQANDSVKKAATYIADTNANNGVAKLIYQIIEANKKER